MLVPIIRALSFRTAAGDTAAGLLQRLDTGKLPGFRAEEVLGQPRCVATVPESMPDVEQDVFQTDTNKLLLDCLEQIRPAWQGLSKEGLGVVIGTSNAGLEEFHRAWLKGPVAPADLRRLEVGGPALFLAGCTEAQGPAYCLSTACSSSAKAMASAVRLLREGVCDAVLAGGSDGLCRYTLAGFESLHLLSEERATPFMEPYPGVNHGEGAALFLIQLGEPQPGDIFLSGYGETSDAYHATTPEPDGTQAVAAMRTALAVAGLQPEDIDYVNLHGTGTRANDTMEIAALKTVFGEQQPPCGTTKPYTGHTLGAAGAVEAAICILLLQRGGTQLPAQPWLSEGRGGELGLDFSGTAKRPLRHVMSNSFAFGGSNACLIFSRA